MFATFQRRLLALRPRRVARTAMIAVAALTLAPAARAADDQLPPFDKVSEGYTQISSSSPGETKGLLNVWKRDKDAQMLGELPKNYAGKSYFIALTVSSGDRYAGLQAGDWVVQWRRYHNRLALIAPNLAVRATGDPEGKASVKRLFTDSVLLDVPILAEGPNGGPVIDLDSLLVGNATKFFGPSVRAANPQLAQLARIEQAKVFEENVELAFEIVGRTSHLQTIHYSISEVPASSNGFKPREADERVGFFTTAFSDLGKYEDDETRVRYINRWHLEKRDPRLKMSLPKEPIRFYIEHTTPVRYRHWVKQGVEYWNEAFEKVGLIDAIEVHYQDAQSGAHMEKDPEDVRHNFIRWLNNDVGTAIGPSRVHPETGEILDADIILTDGWIRHFNFNYHDLMPSLAMEGMSSETLAWLGSNPQWDPRVRLAPAADANHLRQQFAQQSRQPMAGHAMGAADATLLGDDIYDGLYGRISQKNGLCMAADGRHLDLALARMNWALTLLADEEAAKSKKKKKKQEEETQKSDEKAEDKDADKPAEGDDKAAEKDPKAEDKDAGDDGEKESDDEKDADADADEKTAVELLDGMPEWFVGPLLADLVAHEVGHTLGLRHNFKASAVLSLDEINSNDVKGKKPFAGSVMDYTPINYRYEAGEVQGDYAMTGLGPYDFWAIHFGYTLDEKELPEILKRCAEPELQYATDEDTAGPDPLARRYDFGRDPLDYAHEQMKLVKLYRERLLEKFVEDGDSWAKARRGYELTLSLQMRSVSMMANWVGGTFVHRDKKGDPGNRPPIEVVPTEQQRDALEFVIEQTFHDDAYGLTPELLARMSTDKWLDSDMVHAMSSEAAWPIHDRILGIQASALTLLMNPTTLRRVYDNELRLPPEQETLTLPELLTTLNTAVWTELDQPCPADRNDRKPMISSLRRNLQREHMERLLDLVLKESGDTAAYKPISNLARMQLRDLQTRIDQMLSKCGERLDAYTSAHLIESQQKIQRALEANYVYNAGGQQAPVMMFLLGEQPGQPTPGIDRRQQ